MPVFCYASYIVSTESKLYYLQSRYYDPELGRFINADVFASTGQGLLGNNMFAYCGNNPINSLDFSGCRQIQLHDSKAELLNAMLLGAGALVTMAQVPNEQEKVKPYTVYFLYDEEDPNQSIVYVGRVKTINFASRMAYHAAQGRQLKYAINNLDYAQCRVVEQAGMVYYHTINRNNPKHNQIRGISPNNKNINIYLSAIMSIVNEGIYPENIILPVSFWLNLTEEQLLNLV